ncbi:hypothetical protein EU527_05140 [Candidatus Thorarchaeota archaeon]|nr:MAG: hypothetical protein EU527_05140 [Candidatus Thorarchaeota archaeon]
MSEDVFQNAIEILEVDLNSKDMVVLGALLKSQNDPKMYVDFETLRAQLEIDEGGRKGKDSLIYRSLSWLERTGYVEVDRSSHRHGYNSNVRLIHKAIQDSIKGKMNSFENELKELDMEIRSISDIDAELLQSELTDLAAGEKELEKPVFAVEWQNILHLLDEKIYRNLKKGDIIRLTVEWLYRFDELTPLRLKLIENLLQKGVIFKGVEHKKIDPNTLAPRIRILRMWREQGYNLGYRINLREDATYQFIGRNSEGIVLIVSENPFSATWLPRESNPELVDNAIISFDTDYENGIDIFEYGGLD